MKFLVQAVAIFMTLGVINCGRTSDMYEKASRLRNNKIPKPNQNEIERNRVNEESGQQVGIGSLITPCEDCKNLVAKIDSVLKDRAKLEELKTMLNLVCDMAPSSYRDECKEVVQNLDGLSKELAPLLANPELFCRELHLCGNDRKARVLQFFTLFVKKYIYQIDSPENGNSALCDECELVMTEAKTLLNDKSIQDDLKAELESGCRVLGSLKDECVSLVDQFFPQLLQELEQILNDPHQICQELGLCSSTRMAIEGLPMTNSRPSRLTPNVRLNRFRFMFNRLHTKKGMGVSCAMCKFGIGTIVDAIKEDPTILNSIAGDFHDICNIMPSSVIRPSCYDFMETYAKPVIILTLDEINSRQICEDFHLCSDHEIREIQTHGLNRAWKNEVACDACKTMAEFLKYECRQTSFQKSLSDEVKEVCDAVPLKFATSCDNLVDQYVPLVIQMLAQKLESDTVCPDLHLCSRRNGDIELQEITVE